MADVLQVGILFGFDVRVSGEKISEVLWGRWEEIRFLDIDAVGVLGPVAGDEKDVLKRVGFSLRKERRVRPDFQRKTASRVGKGEFKIRFTVFSRAGGSALELCENRSKMRFFVGSGFKRGDVDRAHEGGGWIKKRDLSRIEPRACRIVGDAVLWG